MTTDPICAHYSLYGLLLIMSFQENDIHLSMAMPQRKKHSIIKLAIYCLGNLLKKLTVLYSFITADSICTQLPWLAAW